MKCKLSKSNPFGLTPKGLAYEFIRARSPGGYHLDYGTHSGDFPAALSRDQLIGNAVGVDVNVEAVLAHKDKMPGNVRLEVIKKNAPLGHPAETFDSISIIGVIEHVHQQTQLLVHLRTILKPDGIMVIAVPGKHLFSFLDMGNFKFIFPRIHRFFYEATYSAKEYTDRYVDCKNGLFGDIEVEKMWHEHFSADSMSRLLHTAGLEVLEVDGLGFFQRIFLNLAFFLGGRDGILKPVIDLDSRCFESCELVFLVRKRAGVR